MAASGDQFCASAVVAYLEEVPTGQTVKRLDAEIDKVEADNGITLPKVQLYQAYPGLMNARPGLMAYGAHEVRIPPSVGSLAEHIVQVDLELNIRDMPSQTHQGVHQGVSGYLQALQAALVAAERPGWISSRPDARSLGGRVIHCLPEGPLRATPLFTRDPRSGDLVLAEHVTISGRFVIMPQPENQ